MTRKPEAKAGNGGVTTVIHSCGPVYIAGYGKVGGGGGSIGAAVAFGDTYRTSAPVTGGNATRSPNCEQIPSFKSIGWCRDKGRGWQATVECDRERDRDHPGLHGKVEIDGEIFECIGCLRFMPGRPIRKGELIGLLVRESREEAR